MPKLREVIGWTKTKICCPGTLCRIFVLAVPQTIKLGLTKVGNQAKPLKYLKKKFVFRTKLEWMFKCMATNLDTWLTMMQQRLTCAQCACYLFLIPREVRLENYLFICFEG